MSPHLRLDNVEKCFGRRHVFHSVTLCLGSGTILALTGPNGSGKSTILRIAAGLCSATGGIVEVFGSNPRRFPGVRRRIGYLGHELGLYDDLTARENLEFYAGLFALDGATERIVRSLSLVCLSERSEDRVGSFSRGMKERLALSRTTLNDPELLLLDEPTTGLDGASVEALVAVLLGWKTEGRSVVMTTHDRDLIGQLDATEYALTGAEH